jgi:aldose 1-epimerase
VQDAGGRVDSVVLGFASVPGYLAATGPWSGALVGRFANRLAGDRSSPDYKSYSIDVNAAGNCLHGGRTGFDKRPWRLHRLSKHGYFRCGCCGFTLG